jgi:adenylate cyclase
LGAHDQRVLPERVRQAIRHQQESGEVLVGWLQLVIVIVFAALYAASPKTFSPEAEIEPVPWALAGYFLFTLLRLALAIQRRQPGWFRMVSPAVDVAVLLLLVWSFHIQYHQPASFVLKAPTLLYVFIFIALRALLFDPRYVLVAGVTAAAGWLAVVYYAVAIEQPGAEITHDFVEYMTSNRVLLGAEFDKVISILVVTAVIALAMVRARSLLVRSVAEGQRAHDLERFFAPEVAEQITSAEAEIEPGRGKARFAAILHIDIRGFTELVAQTPPDEIIGFLGEYQAQLMPPIHGNRGTAEKFLGDGMIAAFGAAVESEHYAAQALRAVDGILERVERWNFERAGRGQPEIAIGMAVTTGQVVFGAVGGEARLEYAVVGHPVNLGAKIEKVNKRERTRALCTAAAYQTALAQGYRPATTPERLGAYSVDGVPEPVDLVVLAR